MKTIRRIFPVLLIMALLLGALPTALASGTKTFHTTGKCYMRDEPNREGDLLATLPKGVTFKATDYDVDERGVRWYYGSYKGEVGYVSSKNLKAGKSDDDEKKQTVYLVTTGTCYLRKNADLDSKKLATLPEGTSFKSTKSKKDDRGVRWYYGSYDGMSGYVSEKNLKKGSGGETKKTVYLVTTGTCYLRKSADLDSKKLDTLPAGEYLKSTKSKKDDRGVRWYYVNYDGQNGYISEKNLRKTSSSDYDDDDDVPAPKAIDYSRFKAAGYDAVVTASTLQLRIAPSTDYDIIRTYKTGEQVYVSRSNGSWAEVDDEARGLHGYMSEKYLEPVEADEAVDATGDVDENELTEMSFVAMENPADEALQSGKTVYPMSYELTLDALEDGNYCAAFDKNSLFIAGETNALTLNAEIYTRDSYDIVDIAQLQVGDIIVIDGKPVLVKTLERNDFVMINGGGDVADGWNLRPLDEENCFVVSMDDDMCTYTDCGNAALPLSKALVYTDESLDPSQPATADINTVGGIIAKDTLGYNRYNTTIDVENGQIIAINRFYTP